MTTHPHDGDGLLERYLDGTLDDSGRARVEALLDESPELRSRMRRLRDADLALRRLMSPPPAERLAGIARRAVADHARAAPRSRTLTRRLAVAAAIGAAALGAWLSWNGVASRLRRQYQPPPWRSMAAIYRDEVAAALRPQWRCETDEQFAQTFATRLGQRLLMKPPPPGVETLGLSYAHCLGPGTVYLLARVGGEPVLVFVDRLERDRPQEAPAPPLHLGRRTVGRLVIYELSPHAQPLLLPLFSADPPGGTPP
jgi:hypothetical protein